MDGLLFRLNCAVLGLGLCLVGTLPAAAQIPATLDKGHRILLQRGLQIQAQAFDTTGTFDLNRWAGSNFTTVNWQWGANPALMGAAPGIPWGRWSYFDYHTPDASEIPYLTNYLSLQVWDEPNLGNSTTRQQLATWFGQTRVSFPNTLLFTDIQGHTNTDAQITGFMAESQPDMLMYDSYPVNRNTTIVGGSLKYIYEDMATFRAHGLAGNDGTGVHPIPVGHYLQNFTDDSSTRFLSESEMRDQQFAGWTFGEKFESSFVYDTPNCCGVTPQFFTGLGDANPTPALAQQSESNRESRNLGPALVRLISTDVRFFPGQHKDASNATVSNDVPAGVQTWVSGQGDPYLRSCNAVNLGTTNAGLKGDIIIGWFKVLDESMDGPDANGQIYFMVLNGLTDKNGSAADCRQRITMQWIFGNSGITSLQRLNRDTGLVEDVPLTDSFVGRKVLTFDLDGGTADLFKFNTGAPFVGIDAVPEPASLGLLGSLMLLGIRRRRK